MWQLCYSKSCWNAMCLDKLKTSHGGGGPSNRHILFPFPISPHFLVGNPRSPYLSLFHPTIICSIFCQKWESLGLCPYPVRRTQPNCCSEVSLGYLGTFGAEQSALPILDQKGDPPPRCASSQICLSVDSNDGPNSDT